METKEKVQANWLIDADLKRWIDVEAAKKGMRGAHVIEEMIKLMRQDGKR